MEILQVTVDYGLFKIVSESLLKALYEPWDSDPFSKYIQVLYHALKDQLGAERKVFILSCTR